MLLDLSLEGEPARRPSTVRTKHGPDVAGIVVWWSPYFQQWNITSWHEMERLGQGETKVYRGNPITSSDSLLSLTCSAAKKRFPEETGYALELEPAHIATWATSQAAMNFLALAAKRLVHNEA